MQCGVSFQAVSIGSDQFVMHPGPRQPIPRISLILCVQGHTDIGTRAIASLREQAFRDFECIVVNCSRADPSKEALNAAADGDPRFRIISFRAPASIGAARNTGLRLAQARYVALIQGQYSLPDLSRQLDRMDASRHAGLYVGLVEGPRFDQTVLRADAVRAIGGFVETDEVDDEARFFARLLDAGYTLATGPTEADTIGAKASSRASCSTKNQRDLPILFIPHKDYHVWTIGLLAPQLRALGAEFLSLDLTPQWGEAGVRSSAQRYQVELLGLGEFVVGRFAPSVVVTFNDWDYISRPLVLAARAAGLGTLGIVEGIQDYDDVDTRAERKAYRLVENVILPGAFDYRYFVNASGQRVFISGIPRIQAMRNQPETAPSLAMERRVLINSNFSYGVLTQHRDQWLASAVQAVRRAGYEPVISRHPADMGRLFPELVSTEDFYQTLQTCCASVQRFASGILEAIAYNKPVFYFNIHNEKVDKFTFDPMGAYPVSRSEDELVADLGELHEWQGRVRANGPAFLDLHAGRRTLDIVTKTSEIIAALSAVPVSAEAAAEFYGYLRTIDEMTDALCEPDKGRHGPFAQLDGAVERLRTASRMRNEGTQFIAGQ